MITHERGKIDIVITTKGTIIRGHVTQIFHGADIYVRSDDFNSPSLVVWSVLNSSVTNKFKQMNLSISLFLFLTLGMRVWWWMSLIGWEMVTNPEYLIIFTNFFSVGVLHDAIFIMYDFYLKEDVRCVASICVVFLYFNHIWHMG